MHALLSPSDARTIFAADASAALHCSRAHARERLVRVVSAPQSYKAQKRELYSRRLESAPVVPMASRRAELHRYGTGLCCSQVRHLELRPEHAADHSSTDHPAVVHHRQAVAEILARGRQHGGCAAASKRM